MRTISEQPMDDFPVRPLRFPLPEPGPGVEAGQVVWSRTRPEFSVFLNALAMHVPHFEKFLVAVLREVRPRLADERLRRDVRAIIGQEANHAHNLHRFNALLRARYPDIVPIDDASIADFEHRLAQADLRTKIGFTAGYETFTFLAGMIVLKNHRRWFLDADPTMKALWVWHQVEEIEHGAVAFEVWQALYPNQEWRRRANVLKAALHIAGETLKLYPRMARREGWLRRPLQALRSLTFCAEMLGRLAWAALPVFRRGYHPRRHPIATRAQDPVQIAWRRYEAGGGDVLQIDRQRMADILALAPDA